MIIGVFSFHSIFVWRMAFSSLFMARGLLRVVGSGWLFRFRSLGIFRSTFKAVHVMLLVCILS